MYTLKFSDSHTEAILSVGIWKPKCHTLCCCFVFDNLPVSLKPVWFRALNMSFASMFIYCLCYFLININKVKFYFDIICLLSEVITFT